MREVGILGEGIPVKEEERNLVEDILAVDKHLFDTLQLII